GQQMQHFNSGDADVLAGLTLTNTGTETFSAELLVQGYRELNQSRSSHNIDIQRRYYHQGGQPIALTDQPLTLATGDLMLVELQ
ncbi:hypothetical protein, partial [Gilvimarinus sp. 1_MG-2023]